MSARGGGRGAANAATLRTSVDARAIKIATQPSPPVNARSINAVLKNIKNGLPVRGGGRGGGGVSKHL